MERPSDTTPEAWAHWIDLWRRASPAQKAAQVAELNEVVRSAALAGIRLRHPEADEHEQRMRLAALLFGDDLARRAFGWDPDP